MANSLSAISIAEASKQAQFLLVLLLPTSKISVLNLGIDARHIVALTDLKTNFMALSCRIEGAIIILKKRVAIVAGGVRAKTSRV